MTRPHTFLVRAALCIGVCACHSQPSESPAAPSAAAAPAPAPAAPAAAPQAAGATPAAPAAEDAAPPAEPHKFERTAQMMGTIIRIVVVGMDDAQAAPVVDAALAEMRRLESVLSEWLPDSEISRINAAAGQHPVKVGPDTLANVMVSNQVSAWSDGAFDLSWAALHDLYTFKPGSERVPTRAELDAAPAADQLARHRRRRKGVDRVPQAQRHAPAAPAVSPRATRSIAPPRSCRRAASRTT